MSHFCGHSPQGECGLKFTVSDGWRGNPGHSPQGECGLKFDVLVEIEAELVTPRKGSVD